VNRALALASALCMLLALFFTVTAVSAQSNDSSVRTLVGQVTDGSDAPVASAVVYLKNTKTLALKSYISDDAGQYRFNSLSPNVDYEIYAEYNGQRGATKTISSFDSRTNVNLNLHVDVKR